MLLAEPEVLVHARHYTSRVPESWPATRSAPTARPDRREFLRLAGLAGLGVLAACAESRPQVGPTGPASPTATGSPTGSPAPRALAWRRLPATGPGARRDHTLTANDEGTIAFLFGGRAGGKPLGDLWAFERGSGTWEKIPAKGPAARFGHNAAYVSGHLVLFGGQGVGSTFFNDAWAFDPVGGKWAKLAPRGAAPRPRYGAGGSTIGSSITITHGFNFDGRFDDTWALATAWTDVSPKKGRRPGERCLHRAVYVPRLGKMVLFGGQTTGTSFLGDTWLYDPVTMTWIELTGAAPSPRNLYAAAATADRFILFGGAGSGGPLDDLWSFDGKTWKRLAPAGTPPPARSGIEGAVMAGPGLLVFGGTTGEKELADLWELTLP